MSIAMIPFSIQTCTSQELMQEFHNLINCTQKRYPELLQKMEAEIMKRTENKWLSECLDGYKWSDHAISFVNRDRR